MLLRPHPSIPRISPSPPSFLYQLFFSILARHGKVGSLASLKEAGFPRWLLRWKFFFSQILLPILLCEEIWKEKEERYRGETLHNGFLYLVEQTERWPWYQEKNEKEEETHSSFDVALKTRERERERQRRKKEIYYRRSNIRCSSRYSRDAWPIFVVQHIQRAFFHSPFSYKRETRVEKEIIYRNGSTLMYNVFLLIVTNEVFCRRRCRKMWKQLRSSLKRNSGKG